MGVDGSQGWASVGVDDMDDENLLAKNTRLMGPVLHSSSKNLQRNSRDTHVTRSQRTRGCNQNMFSGLSDIT